MRAPRERAPNTPPNMPNIQVRALFGALPDAIKQIGRSRDWINGERLLE